MLNIRLPKLRKPGIIREERGFTLIEVLISIVLLGLITASLAFGLGSASKGLVHNDSRQTAKNLAESQIEYIKNLPFASAYDTSYHAGPPVTGIQLPTGYSLSNVIHSGTDSAYFNPIRDANIQLIIITITGPGNVTYTLKDYKVR
jgi:prepilin-type N-terminal cleavage/methylation domain-containing protein